MQCRFDSQGGIMSGSKLLVIPVLLFVFFGFHSAAFAEQVTYEYDDYGRLTSASYDDGYALTRIIYTYDNVGNFVSESITRQDNLNPQLWGSLKLGWATMMPDFNELKNTTWAHATTASRNVSSQEAINNSLDHATSSWNSALPNSEKW
jgi:hypothetical protein